MNNKLIKKYITESGSRSDFKDHMFNVIKYLNKALEEASKEGAQGFPELKQLQKTMIFLQKIGKKYTFK